MEKATLAQAVQILNLIRAKNIPLHQVQNLLASGLLSDLLQANISQINRREFQAVCKIRPIKINGYKVWATVLLGSNQKNAEGYCKVLEDDKYSISNICKEVIRKPSFTISKKMEVPLFRLTLEEIGFKRGCIKWTEIVKRFNELGFQYCPSDVGPELRLKYGKQEVDDDFAIFMEPIADSQGILRIFGLENKEGMLKLKAYGDVLDFNWYKFQSFIVCKLPKP
jgi:hypothetical protein